jgi:BlaI family transcriptional regulator, penicillinase repressor
MRPRSSSPPAELPALEQECMKVLWSRGQGTVHEVRAELFPRRPLAYTTVETLLQRLAGKGVLMREKRGRRHLYRPALPAEMFREHAIDRVVRDFFAGSRELLRQHLAAVPLSSQDVGSSPLGARVRPRGRPRPADNPNQ